jgi:hypothetical protein
MRIFKPGYIIILALALYGVTVPALVSALNVPELLLLATAPNHIVLSEVTSVRTIAIAETPNTFALIVKGTVGSVENTASGYGTVSVGNAVDLMLLFNTYDEDRMRINHCRNVADRTFDNPNKRHFGFFGTPSVVDVGPDGEPLLAFVQSTWACTSVKP